jgi:hypothetical protein
MNSEPFVRAQGSNFGNRGNVMTRKIGRNDPCPCGSGKKYKKCCGPKGTYEAKDDVPYEPAVPDQFRDTSEFGEYEEELEEYEEEPEDEESESLHIPSSLLRSAGLSGDDLQDPRISGAEPPDEDDDLEFDEDDDLEYSDEVLQEMIDKYVTNPEVKRDPAEMAFELRELFRTDPHYVQYRLEENDFVVLLKTIGWTGEPDPPLDLSSQWDRLARWFRKDDYELMIEECLEDLRQDFWDSSSNEFAYLLAVTIRDVEAWLEDGRNRTDFFWQAVFDATLADVATFQTSRLFLADLYARQALALPERARQYGLQGRGEEEMFDFLAQHQELALRIDQEITDYEDAVVEAIELGEIEVPIPDEWARYGFAIMYMHDFGPLDETLETEEIQDIMDDETQIMEFARDAASYRLAEDVQEGLARVLANTPEDSRWRIPLALFAELVPMELFGGFEQISSAVLGRKCIHAMHNSKQYREQRVREDDPEQHVWMVGEINQAIKQGNLTRAAALALAGAVLEDESPEVRFYLSGIARNLGIPDEGEEEKDKQHPPDEEPDAE